MVAAVPWSTSSFESRKPETESKRQSKSFEAARLKVAGTWLQVASFGWVKGNRRFARMPRLTKGVR